MVAVSSGKAMLDRFTEKEPLAVMTRTVIESVVGDILDDLFEEHRSSQYDGGQKFSTVALAMSEIVLGTVKNRNQAYAKYAKELGASKTAFYEKLKRIEPQVSEAIVDHSAKQADVLLQNLAFQGWEVLPGFRCVSIDGNHLQKSERRLKEARGIYAAMLPGTIVARYDHQSGLFDKAYVLEDAHAQEATVLDRAVEDLGENDLVIADRHFCIVRFMMKLANRLGFFLIRQHGRLKGHLKGERQRKCRIDSGVVYEQAMEISDGEQTLTVRRITVVLDDPTRDGDTELHLLSNVAESAASAGNLAKAYRQRWEIENGFHQLTMTLNCEHKGNCVPRCALFQFCMAMLAYNCRQVMMASLYEAHDDEEVDQISPLHMARDMVSPLPGLNIAINPEEWRELVPTAPVDVAKFLINVARQLNVRRYKKATRGPKKKQPQPKRCKSGSHMSAYKVLQARKERC